MNYKIIIGILMIIAGLFLISSTFASSDCELLDNCFGMEGYLMFIASVVDNPFLIIPFVTLILFFIFGGLFIIIE